MISMFIVIFTIGSHTRTDWYSFIWCRWKCCSVTYRKNRFSKNTMCCNFTNWPVPWKMATFGASTMSSRNMNHFSLNAASIWLWKSWKLSAIGIYSKRYGAAADEGARVLLILNWFCFCLVGLFDHTNASVGLATFFDGIAICWRSGHNDGRNALHCCQFNIWGKN